MKYQVLDSGLVAPVVKSEPEVKSLLDLRQDRRMKAGYPKIIKLWDCDREYLLYIIGDEIYTDFPIADIHYQLVDEQELNGNWHRIECEELC